MDSSKGDHQNVRRSLMILKALSTAPSTGLRPIDVATLTGLGKASAHRILMGMANQGMVDSDPATGRFMVGMKVIGWALSAFDRFGVSEAAFDALQDLTELTGDTAYLTMRSGDHICCLDAREGAFPIKAVLMQVGQRAPLGIGASGLAVLSALPDADGLAVAQRVAAADPALHPLLAPEALAGRIRTVRATGYAVDEGHILPGISAVAAAIVDAGSQPVAAISVAAIATRLAGPRRAQVGQLVKQAARAVEARLAPGA